jgi:hypothetical protein
VEVKLDRKIERGLVFLDGALLQVMTRIGHVAYAGLRFIVIDRTALSTD